MINFDLIKSIFKCWFWFEFFCFKAVVHTKRINFLVKGFDSWYIHGSGGDNFQMIFFDISNSLFKCGFRFEFFCFKSVVHTKRIKSIVKRCSNLVIRNCDGSLTDIPLITLVDSDRQGVFELRVISSSSIYFDSWCCCSMKSINSSSDCSKIWSDL